MTSKTTTSQVRQISTFFKEDLPSFGAYDNTRKIASYVDGLKNSQRKVLFTMMEKYPKDFIKTETLANVCAAFTNYLHGAANLGGVIGTMTQNFIGANNYPLLVGNSGGFGTRINPTCAASRYTRNALGDLVKTLISKSDDKIIGRQFFEGDYIEPKFFIPVFPVIFLNGSSGLSTGFSQDILPRNPEDVITYIKKKISGTEKPRVELKPWFKGHLGTVELNAETNSYEVFGVVTKNNTTSYTVTELPIGVEYQKYCELLDKMCDSGTIVDYDDKCNPKTDNICFEIKTTREFSKKYEGRKLFEVFRLVKSLPETLNCIDEGGRVREFSSVQEILDAFIKIRLDFYNQRKAWLLSTLKGDLQKLASKYLFIKGIIDGTIIVNKKKKKEIVKQIENEPKIIKIDNSYDYLLSMAIYSLSAERLEELKKQIEEAKAEYNKINETTIEQMWTNDLNELKKVL